MRLRRPWWHGTLHGARLSTNCELGVFVGGAGAEFAASRLLVDKTRPQQSDHWVGRGLEVQDLARIDLAGAHIVGNRVAGLFSAHGVVRVVGTTIANTATNGAFSLGGPGLWLDAGSSGSIAACSVRDNQALAVGMDGSTLQIVASVLSGTALGKYPELGSDGQLRGCS